MVQVSASEPLQVPAAAVVPGRMALAEMQAVHHRHSNLAVALRLLVGVPRGEALILPAVGQMEIPPAYPLATTARFVVPVGPAHLE